MNKKTLFSLVGAASIAVSLSATAPVLAAETTNPNPTSTTTNTPSTGQTGTTDTTKPTDNAGTSKEPTPSKPINTADLNKAMSLNAKYAKLTRNSYVYDAKGKRVKNAKLKKGTIIFVSGLTTPDGQVLIGYNNKKGRYIKVNNVVLFKAVQYKVKKNAYVYNSKGKRNTRVYVPKGKTITVFKTKKINDIKYVAFSNSQYIKWSVLDHKSGKVISG
ncbi:MULTISPECIES: SLAP domain-containing protein [Lactobacillus]|uniref:SLAP domain-containing protein n=1 Tax=Lactobacillus TaxID=1578 RepID=UPI0018DC6B4D|nr:MULTISPECIES: SLAP domain-containing protein [Lactobacillus]MBI0021894.1 SLAP domain-containing protein [Lactobacillus sp. W8172]MCT6890421.1 SLAP domain-containing protein [Lactobacillus sp.]